MNKSPVSRCHRRVSHYRKFHRIGSHMLEDGGVKSTEEPFDPPHAWIDTETG